jgi:transcriptional regulator with XRE-family HTH domain
MLIAALKRALRQQGLTYAQVGKDLGLSESSVKRIFSTERLSLERLEEICALMGLAISDLLDLTRNAERRITELSEEQEHELVGNPKTLLVAILAISHWTASKILETYQLSNAELVKILARLDKMGVIELLPDNRIKVRLARNFNWRKAGPIQKFFEERVQRQFFASSFLGPGELRVMVHGSLSARSIELLQQRMRKISEEFDALVSEDRQLDHAMREGTTLLLAIRPWELGMFTELRHKKPKP